MRHAALAIIAATALGASVLAPVRAELLPEQNGVDAAALLAPHGYTDVEVLRRHIDRVEAEACRDGARWRVSLAFLSGRARATERLGECAGPIVVDAPAVPDPRAARSVAATLAPDASASTPPSSQPTTAVDEAGSSPGHRGALPPWSEEDQAMRALERVGYTGVRIRKWGREGWRGTACREGRLREVRLSAALVPAAPIRAMRDCPEGRDTPRDLTVGPPEPPIRSVRDVKARLLKRGYTEVGRIEIEDGAFHALACERGWRFRVTVVPAGEVRGRRNLGRCEAAEGAADGPARVSASLPAGD